MSHELHFTSFKTTLKPVRTGPPILILVYTVPKQTIQSPGPSFYLHRTNCHTEEVTGVKQTVMHVGHNTQKGFPTRSVKYWTPKNQLADLQALSFGLSLHFLATNRI